MTDAPTRFRDAAALFALFARSGWRSCQVGSDGLEFFAARPGGGANPLLGRTPPVPPAEPAMILRAPHLGTVVALAAIGTMIAAGETFARLELLGEAVELKAERGGTVLDHLHPVGTLIEHDQALLSLS